MLFCSFQSLSSVKEDDTISVYVFGEDEDRLEKEAFKNGGFLKFDQLADHFGEDNVQTVRCLFYLLHGLD